MRCHDDQQQQEAESVSTDTHCRSCNGVGVGFLSLPHRLELTHRRAAFGNKLVRPRWPYDMRPSARSEKYIRDAGP